MVFRGWFALSYEHTTRAPCCTTQANRTIRANHGLALSLPATVGQSIVTALQLDPAAAQQAGGAPVGVLLLVDGRPVNPAPAPCRLHRYCYNPQEVGQQRRDFYRLNRLGQLLAGLMDGGHRFEAIRVEGGGVVIKVASGAGMAQWGWRSGASHESDGCMPGGGIDSEEGDEGVDVVRGDEECWGEEEGQETWEGDGEDYEECRGGGEDLEGKDARQAVGGGAADCVARVGQLDGGGPVTGGQKSEKGSEFEGEEEREDKGKEEEREEDEEATQQAASGGGGGGESGWFSLVSVGEGAHMGCLRICALCALEVSVRDKG